MEKKYIIILTSIYLIISIFYLIIYNISSFFILNRSFLISTFLYIFLIIGFTLICISVYFTYTFNFYKAILLGFVGVIFITILVGYDFVDHFSNTIIYFYPIFPVENLLMMSFLLLIALYVINLILIVIMKKLRRTDINLIKTTILELGTKFTSLHVKEISQKTKSEKSIITNIIKEMIKKGEIHAEYFSTTSIVAFDQSANIEVIDKLMDHFKKLEENNTAKI